MDKDENLESQENTESEIEGENKEKKVHQTQGPTDVWFRR